MRDCPKGRDAGVVEPGQKRPTGVEDVGLKSPFGVEKSHPFGVRGFKSHPPHTFHTRCRRTNLLSLKVPGLTMAWPKLPSLEICELDYWTKLSSLILPTHRGSELDANGQVPVTLPSPL